VILSCGSGKSSSLKVLTLKLTQVNHLVLLPIGMVLHVNHLQYSSSIYLYSYAGSVVTAEVAEH
jgi:hypothetical protein